MNYYLNNSTNCLNTYDSFNNVSGSLSVSNHYTVPDQQPEILRWLSPLEPRVRHQDIQTQRADNVGDWLLETGEFRSWRRASGEVSRENAALFCYGDPGVGKTYLSSLVIDRLGDEANGQPDVIACFYFDFAARNEQTPANMLGSLLKQIIGGFERIPKYIVQAFEEQRKIIGGRRLQVPEIVKMLQTVTCSQRTYICVDALDECAEKHRPEVLGSLREILEKCEGARMFITGRRHICGEIEKHLPRKTSTVPISPNNEDIRGYIRMRLSKGASLGAIDIGFKAEIAKSFAENIPESFLLVSITLDSILRETTLDGRRKKLLAMAGGSDVKDAYSATLERIQEQGGARAKLGISALMWISHSEWPLRPDELLHALTVEKEATEPNPENTPSIQTLISCCLGLVTFDAVALRVRLIHFTLQEYLYTRSDLYANAHSKIAETCLIYLNFPSIKDLSPTLGTAPLSAPFLEYCSLYWGVHAKRQTSSGVISLALELFSQFESHLSTKLLLRYMLGSVDEEYLASLNSRIDGFTGLHCASLFGIFAIVSTFTEKTGRNLNKRDFTGFTPLLWAAIFGQEEVVKLLLEQPDIHPNKVDKHYGRTPLSLAAEKGLEGVVKVLLGCASRNPDGMDSLWSKTPGVADLLFRKRNVNTHKADKSGLSPLSLAAGNGHEGVVKLLLGRGDVNPSKADKGSWTPLSLAACHGHEGVVKLLLGRGDVNPDKASKYGTTPLSQAACNGHEGVVKLLLGRGDVNSNKASKFGWTPLSLAASHGHEGVVKLLLGRGDVNPDKEDKRGRTPLSWTASRGHEGVVKLLLGREDVNPNLPDNIGRTPLSWAVGHRPFLLSTHDNEGVVKLLLGCDDVNPHIPDNTGRTPLWWAAYCGSQGPAKLLLGRDDVDPNIPDKDGQAPLSCATDNGHERVVNLLPERKDVNSNRPDNKERKLFALLPARP